MKTQTFISSPSTHAGKPVSQRVGKPVPAHSPTHRLTRLLACWLTLALCACTAGACPVQFNLADLTGQPLNLPITVTPRLRLLVDNGTIIASGAPLKFTPVAGTLTTNLHSGIYDCAIQGVSQGFVINVADDSTNLVTATSIRISGLTQFSATNLNATLQYFATNAVAAGTNVTLRTNGSTVTISVPLANLDTISGNGGGLTNLSTNGIPGLVGTLTAQVASNIAIINLANSKVNPANNGADFASMATARGNLAILDIAAQTGNNAPEFAWTNATAAFVGQIGIIKNSGYTGVYTANSVTPGDWSGSWLFNGPQAFGTATNMPALAEGHVFTANGNPIYQNTNGALGTENVITLRGRDPKQGSYIGFSAPSSGNGAANIVMSNDQDFQIGMGGWAYGTNTLAGLALANDGIIAINAGHDLHFCTTVDRGGFGARDTLAYDNLNGIWYFGLDVSGNGAFNNTGFKYLAKFDAKTPLVTFATNTTVNGTFTAQGAAVVLACNNTVVGNNGIGNTGGGSFGLLKLNTAGTAGAPTLLMSGNTYVNADSSGNLELGKFSAGTTNDYKLIVDQGGSVVIVTTNLNVMGGLITNNGTVWLSTNNTPAASLPNGSIATVTDGRFYVRSNSTWVLH